MVLLNEQDQNNLVTICDMMNLDLATATLQYLESNRNMDQWAQRYVVFCTVCWIHSSSSFLWWVVTGESMPLLKGCVVNTIQCSFHTTYLKTMKRLSWILLSWGEGWDIAHTNGKTMFGWLKCASHTWLCDIHKYYYYFNHCLLQGYYSCKHRSTYYNPSK